MALGLKGLNPINMMKLKVYKIEPIYEIESEFVIKGSLHYDTETPQVTL